MMLKDIPDTAVRRALNAALDDGIKAGEVPTDRDLAELCVAVYKTYGIKIDIHELMELAHERVSADEDAGD